MEHIDINQAEKDFFRSSNPLKRLLKLTLDLLGAEQVGILYGTDASKKKFLPNNEWDRGVMDAFDGVGLKGYLLRYFGTTIVSLKKLSPVYFYNTAPDGSKSDNDGIIAYILRNCADYYKNGISILFSPDISANIYRVNDQYVEIPFYAYNGETISPPDIKIRVDLNIVKHFKAKNYISVYIPDYGIMVVNTVDPELMTQVGSRFVRNTELKRKFDILIHLVEIISLAVLGQLKGKRGAHLLWKKEKLLRETSRELIENEKKYRDLYENAPIAYFSLDPHGVMLKCNYNTVKLCGYDMEDLKGKNFLDFYVKDANQSVSPGLILEKLKQGKVLRDVELKFRNKDSKDVWVSLSFDAVRDKNGQFIEIRATAIDISERKSLEKQLLNAQKMEAIGTLARGLAHDFNNILSPIAGYSEMLLMDMKNSCVKDKEHLRIIFDCAMYAKGLVNQMLTFSKQKGAEFKPIRPHTFVEDALILAKSFIPSTIEIKKNIRQDCDIIMVDPIQAHQVVMNLLSNAYHAMEKDGGELSIFLDEVTIESHHEIFPLQPGKYTYLNISDTGPGMAPEVMERIFDPFYTTKEEGKGSGIGLSVVHGIVQSHNGYINVKSKPGQGTTFEIYLPSHKGEEDTIPETDETRPIEKGSERILLVDDDKKVAYMVQHMLEKLGYSVTCFIQSPEALETFKKDPFAHDLVITDLTMPNMTGYQLAEKINAIRNDIPIILCTGFGEHINKEQYEALGIKGFLNKPVSVKSVSNRIREVLEATQG